MFIFLVFIVPMMLYILFLSKKSEITYSILVIYSTSVFIIGFVIAVDVIFKHTKDIGIVRAYYKVIYQREKTVKEITDALRSSLPQGIQLPRHGLSLNADSPIATYFKKLMEAKIAVMKAREVIAKAKVRIAQRKAGPMWWVVAIYGEK